MIAFWGGLMQNVGMAGHRERLEIVRERMARACERSGRDLGDVTLVAVSKTYSVEDILRVYELGIRDFGESRLQEAQTKVHVLPDDIRWHFIGSLQSNKAKKVGEIFDFVHSLEKEKQVREIEKAMRTVVGFLQVNLGKEAQKSGILPENLDRTLSSVLKSQTVQLRGLMTIGPQMDDPEKSRELFRSLRVLAKDCQLPFVSMGMSGDFEVAIEEGATHVRVGSLLFGQRS